MLQLWRYRQKSLKEKIDGSNQPSRRGLFKPSILMEVTLNLRSRWAQKWLGRRHNPSVNSRIVKLGVHMFSTEYRGGIGAIGASEAHNSAKSSAKFCILKKLS
jgi:hypothetical protein